MIAANPNLYREVSCVLLGGLIGALISVPLTVQQGGLAALALPPLMLVTGALIGYRRRKSLFFFYFSIIAALALSWLMVGNAQIYQ